MTKRRQRGEGSLFKRADGQWVGRVDLGWIDGKRRRPTVYGKTMAEAQEKLNQAKAKVASGNTQTRGTRVDQWLEVWLGEVVPGKKKMTPRTLAGYESHARNYLLPVLGRVRLDQLGARHVREVHRYVMTTKGLSATTAGHVHATLSACLNDAIREGLITSNPCELVDHPKGANSNMRRALTMDEVRRVFWELDHPAWRLTATRWLTAFLLGMRQGECLGLRWDRIDFDAGTITIDTQLQRIPYVKGTRELRTLPGYDYTVVRGNLCLVTTKTESSKRVLPLPDILADALLQHDCNTATIDNLAGLVWTRPTGAPIEPTDDRQEWHGLLAAAGVPDTDQHSARHTTATLLLALGVGEDVRQAILGHSTAAARKIYSHVDIALAARAMGELERAITDTNPQQPRGGGEQDA